MPSPTVRRKQFSFDGSSQITSNYSEPDRYASLFEMVKTSHAISLQGSNLSPALSSATQDGLTLNLRHFNRILEFSASDNTVKVEPGIKIGDLLMFLSNKNKWLSVTPGHPNITLGGCIGHNIHGKGSGYFRDIVSSFEIFHPKTGELQCSEKQNPELFELTIGGLGSTGIITSMVLKVEDLQGQCIIHQKKECNNLEDACEQLIEAKTNKSQLLYSWNNFSAKKRKNFGEGYLFIDRYGEAQKKSNYAFYDMSPQSRRSSALHFLSPWITPFISPTYALLQKWKPREQSVGLFEGTFPIAGKEVYYSAMGQKGFLEFQVLIPTENITEFGDAVWKAVQKFNPVLTLGSLKYLNGNSKYLRFCKPGIVLTINAFHNQSATPFFNELDKAVLDCGGIPNLSKDSRLSHSFIKSAYGSGWKDFTSDLEAFDPNFTFQSHLIKKVLGDL